MGRVSLVVTDLDGTLWRSEQTVHERTLAAWHELERAGVPVLVATGRRLTSTRNALGRHGLAPPTVVLDGGLGVEATDERFWRRTFDPGRAARVLAVFGEVGLSPCVYVDDPTVEVFVSTTPSTHPGHLESLAGKVATADLHEVVASGAVFAFGLIGCPPELLEEVVASTRGVAEARVNTSFDYGGGTVMVVDRDVSKWDGVLAFCARHGLEHQRVLAIGDGPNDVELLSGAAVALSLEGSSADALFAADHVVGPVDEGGWAELVSYLG